MGPCTASPALTAREGELFCIDRADTANGDIPVIWAGDNIGATE